MSENVSFEALAIPAVALEQGGVEVLRAAIVDNGLHVTLRRAFDDVEAWGMLLADVARHIARIYATEDGRAEAATLAVLAEVFAAEMEAPTDPGTTGAVN